MNNRSVTIEVDEEIAFHFIVKFAANHVQTGYSNYGYDLYIPNIIRAFMREQGINEYDAEKYIPTLSSSFYAAAWELCRRGILRPGISRYGAQSTDDGNAGNGYSITQGVRCGLRSQGNMIIFRLNQADLQGYLTNVEKSLEKDFGSVLKKLFDVMELLHI